MVSVAPAQRCEEVEKHSFSVYGFEPSEKQEEDVINTLPSAEKQTLSSAALKPLQNLQNVNDSTKIRDQTKNNWGTRMQLIQKL